jgi:hypothetical protein
MRIEKSVNASTIYVGRISATWWGRAVSSVSRVEFWWVDQYLGGIASLFGWSVSATYVRRCIAQRPWSAYFQLPRWTWR